MIIDASLCQPGHPVILSLAMKTFDIPVRCSCASVRGVLRAVSPSSVVRGVCYCDDCQAFAHHVGQADTVLDNYGGTSILQASPNHLTITEGAQHLSCVRLGDRNLLRWYTACCGTPVGNTFGSHKFHVLGLIHACLDLDVLDVPVHKALGPVRSRAFRKFALGDRTITNALPGSLWPFVFGGLRRMLRGRLTGAYRSSPFFDDAGAPVSAPHLLTPEERSRLPPYASA